MDRVFPGSYALTPDALAELWPQAIFSFDTNVLLSVYSYSPETRSELLQAMEQIGTRGKIFLTWQVMTEFHRLRMDKIREQDTTADQLTDAFKKLCDAIDDKIKRSDGHHPDVDLEQIRQIAEEAREKATPLLAHTERGRVDPLNDDFLRQITSIFGEAIGTRPTPDEDRQHREEGSRRAESKIPPGFADNRKKDGGVGDYLIWVELLKLAEREKLPVIFVTNDRKPDWWEHYERESQEREPIAPRMELVNEMQAHANVRYHQLLPLEFVELELKSELSPVVANELSRPPRDAEIEPVRRYVPNDPPWEGLARAIQEVEERDQQFRRAVAGALAPSYELREQARAALGAALYGAEVHVGESIMRSTERDLVNAATGGWTEAMIRVATGGDLTTKLAEVSRMDLADKALGLSAIDAAIDPRTETH